MGGRRLKGQGTITEHSSGMVRAQVSLGTRPDGRRNRLTAYFHDAAAAQAWIDAQRLLLARDGRLPSRLPLGDFLADWIRRGRRSGSLAPRTAGGYEAILAAMPGRLVATQLGALTASHVQSWLDSMAGSSPRTVAWKRNMLRAALNDALARELVDRNPAALARPPRQRRPRRVVLSAADCSAILAACDARTVERDGRTVEVPRWRYHAAVAVSIGCGLRQGELLALSWADVGRDRIVVRGRLRREAGKYRVAEGTKAEDGPRTVPLPAFARDALAAWRAVQDAERRAAGDVEPIDQSEVPVFSTARGALVNGSALTHQFQDRLEAAGLPKVPWHAMRHATADVLAERGVAITVARDYLRHASQATTADHYTGSGWASLASAALEIDAAIG